MTEEKKEEKKPIGVCISGNIVSKIYSLSEVASNPSIARDAKGRMFGYNLPPMFKYRDGVITKPGGKTALCENVEAALRYIVLDEEIPADPASGATVPSDEEKTTDSLGVKVEGAEFSGPLYTNMKMSELQALAKKRGNKMSTKKDELKANLINKVMANPDSGSSGK